MSKHNDSVQGLVYEDWTDDTQRKVLLKPWENHQGYEVSLFTEGEVKPHTLFNLSDADAQALVAALCLASLPSKELVA